MGEILAETEKHPPGPQPKIGARTEPIPAKLSDMGIAKKLSSRSQKLAAVPVELSCSSPVRLSDVQDSLSAENYSAPPPHPTASTSSSARSL